MRVRAARALREIPAPGTAGALHYYDAELGADTAKILPGEYLATATDIALVTLLGSCVAACVRDPVAGVGGMNHFMLPDGGDGVAGESARYGSYAMEMLLNELLKLGASRVRLEAKVFGGGAVLRGFTRVNVGERNARFVNDYLADEHIPILAEDLLDVHPRKIAYFPRTGRTLVKRLPAVVEREVGGIEQLYRERLREKPVAPGAVELFE